MSENRRDRERELHREEILDAAEVVFVREGVGARIETIAKEADFAVGSLYNFFASKEDLFKNVLLRISELRIADIEGRMGDILREPWNGLRMLCMLWTQHHLCHGHFLDFAKTQSVKPFGTILPSDDPVEIKILENIKRYRELLLTFFGALGALSDVRLLNVDVMLTTFEGYIRTAFFTEVWYLHGDMTLFPSDDFVERVFSALNQLFRR